MINIGDAPLRTVPASAERGMAALIGMGLSAAGAFMAWGWPGALMCLGLEMLGTATLDAIVERITLTRLR